MALRIIDASQELQASVALIQKLQPNNGTFAEQKQAVVKPGRQQLVSLSLR